MPPKLCLSNKINFIINSTQLEFCQLKFSPSKFSGLVIFKLLHTCVLIILTHEIRDNFTCVLSSFLKIIIIWANSKWNYSFLSRVYCLITFLLFLTWLSYRKLHVLKSLEQKFLLNYKFSIFWIFWQNTWYALLCVKVS